jgi:predicted DNA-binding antitoxin AbrB/MazE fold protein
MHYYIIKITIKDFAKNFVETGKAIDLQNGRFFIPDFIDHQYPSGLQINNKAHGNFISELLKYDVITEIEDGTFKPLQSPLQGSKVMVKVMVQEKVMVKAKDENQFKKPSVEEIAIYLLQKYPKADRRAIDKFSEKFWNHYENNGWKVGKNKMKSWILALTSWSETIQKDLFPMSITTSGPLSFSSKNMHR